MAEVDVPTNRPVILTESKFCGSCETILCGLEVLGSNPATFRKEHNEHSLGFFRPREAGIKAATCHLCALFISLFSNDDQRELNDDDLRIRSQWSSSGTLQAILIGKKSLLVLQYDKSSERLSPIHDRVESAPPSSSTWSRRLLDRVDGWLNNCVMDHEECSKGIYSGFLPSRLIDIGLDGENAPRLVDKSVLSGRERYVSLSHCWGGRVPLVLRKDNVAAMKMGINYEDLPTTFQHALAVTREIKCRYIWIDSLCIMQDSLEDWIKESSQMHQVYSNALCNIAASASRDSTGGLFFHRNPGSIIPLRMTISQIAYVLDPPNVQKYRMVEQAPLNSRGWVYQERFFSSRTLHFTASQLFWQCKTHWASERYPITSDEIFLPQLKRFDPGLDGIAIRRRDGGHIFNASGDAFLDAFAVWKEIVAQYSKCNLTRETDKLVAISGIAAKVNEILDDDYLAGMWRDHLPYSLTWQAFGENKKPNTYTAPSWSWASICGAVQTKSLKNLRYERSVKIIKADVELASPSKFGQVKGGFIQLQGSLMATPLSICHSGKPDGSSCAGCIAVSETLSLRFSLDISRPEVDRHEEARQRLHFPVIPTKGLDAHLLVYGMPILAYWSGDYREVEGLLLETSGNTIGEFNRIGTFSHGAWRDAQGEAPSQYLEALRAFDSQAVSLGLEPVPTNGPDYDVQYIITIT